MKFRNFLENWNLGDLKIQLFQLEAEFAPRDADRKAAYELYVELTTRVVTQSSVTSDAHPEELLASVYSLFSSTRDLLKKHGPDCPTFESLALQALNQIIRPFTSKWHRIGSEDAFQDPQKLSEFHSEFGLLQRQLRSVTGALAAIANVEYGTRSSENAGPETAERTFNDPEGIASASAGLFGVPSLPQHFLGRTSEQSGLKKMLMSGAREPGRTVAVVVEGLGGIGKTVLAAGVAHDPEIRRVFSDGVFWVPMGQTSKILDLQTSLSEQVKRAWNLDLGTLNVMEATGALRGAFKERKVLLILDDAWNIDHVASLNVVSPQGRVLVTTRKADLAEALGGERIIGRNLVFDAPRLGRFGPANLTFFWGQLRRRRGIWASPIFGRGRIRLAWGPRGAFDGVSAALILCSAGVFAVNGRQGSAGFHRKGLAVLSR